MKCCEFGKSRPRRSRSPCGERGLKLHCMKTHKANCTSLPVRGAWVEIFLSLGWGLCPWSLPVRGAWVEMSSMLRIAFTIVSRSPCGERGLKSLKGWKTRLLSASLPVRGAWVEILLFARRCADVWSLPVRGAWVEIPLSQFAPPCQTSLPVRGAWVEIKSSPPGFRRLAVAPRAGSVG